MWSLLGGSDLQIIRVSTEPEVTTDTKKVKQKENHILDRGNVQKKREIEVWNWSAQENGKGRFFR